MIFFAICCPFSLSLSLKLPFKEAQNSYLLRTICCMDSRQISSTQNRDFGLFFPFLFSIRMNFFHCAMCNSRLRTQIHTLTGHTGTNISLRRMYFGLRVRERKRRRKNPLSRSAIRHVCVNTQLALNGNRNSQPTIPIEKFDFGAISGAATLKFIHEFLFNEVECVRVNESIKRQSRHQNPCEYYTFLVFECWWLWGGLVEPPSNAGTHTHNLTFENFQMDFH